MPTIVIAIKENYSADLQIRSDDQYHPSHLPFRWPFSPLGRKEPSETHLLIHQPFPISQKSSLKSLFLISSNGTQCNGMKLKLLQSNKTQ